VERPLKAGIVDFKSRYRVPTSFSKHSRLRGEGRNLAATMHSLKCKLISVHFDCGAAGPPQLLQSYPLYRLAPLSARLRPELHLPQETHLTLSHSCDQQPPPLGGLASIYAYIHIRRQKCFDCTLI
jgi:hypothetical protein